MPPKKGKAKKAGRHNRFEPTTIKEITTSPSALSYFQKVGYFYFCNKIQEVTNYPLLNELFSLRLDGEKVDIVGLEFVLTPKAVLKETTNKMKVASMRPAVTLKLIKTAHKMIRKAMSANNNNEEVGNMQEENEDIKVRSSSHKGHKSNKHGESSTHKEVQNSEANEDNPHSTEKQ